MAGRQLPCHTVPACALAAVARRGRCLGMGGASLDPAMFLSKRLSVLIVPSWGAGGQDVPQYGCATLPHRVLPTTPVHKPQWRHPQRCPGYRGFCHPPQLLSGLPLPAWPGKLFSRGWAVVLGVGGQGESCPAGSLASVAPESEVRAAVPTCF